MSLKVESVNNCLLCKEEGTLLYDHLSDRFFGSPGTWRLVRCSSDGLVWLTPRPAKEDIPKIYSKYYTHVSDSPGRFTYRIREGLRTAICAAMAGAPSNQAWPWRLAGRVATLFPPLREAGRLGARCLTQKEMGRLLDVGCGDGRFLSLMRSFGWDVRGIDPDPEAARVAKHIHKLNVDCCTLDDIQLPSSAFDVITLHHVIEHAPNPLELLNQCRRLLSASGLLVIVTPNLGSIGHRLFSEKWRDLDPPRHFYLFDARTLSECVTRSGFRILSRTTSARWAYEISKASSNNSSGHGLSPVRRRFVGLCFQFAESFLKYFSRDSGEELVLRASPV